MHPEGQCSRCWVAHPTSSLHGILVVARLRPSPTSPYTEYWSRLPAWHLLILSPSAYAAWALFLLSNSLHVPGGTMLEMLGRSSNQFSARYTGPGCLRGPLFILSPSACATVVHLFPSRSLLRTWKDGVRDAGFPSSSLPRTRKDGDRDAGFLSPPTTTSLTTGVDTHVAGENESRSRIETLFIENCNSSKHPPIDMTRLSYPFGVAITLNLSTFRDRSLVSTDVISERDSTPRPLRP